MPVLQPSTLDEALALRAADPELVLLSGGTEVMPARNRGDRPGPLLDLSRVAELGEVAGDGDVLRLGANVTLTRAIEELADRVPVLALAARTVASRQVRNRATLGGTVAVADPSADVLAALVAADAEVELGSASGARRLPLTRVVAGPFQSAVRADELVTAVIVPATPAPAAYAKVGARNAMARAICAVAVTLHGDRALCAVAACGPVPVRVELASGDDVAAVVAAIEPRDDRRGSAAYKRHATAVLARRALARARRAA